MKNIYTSEQRRRAEVVAFMIDHAYFDFTGICRKAKNGVFWTYDYADDRKRPVSILELASDYAEIDPELIADAESRIAARAS